MCYKTKFYTELGEEFCIKLGKDPEKWSRKCPLPPPAYFDDSLNYFIESYQLALRGQDNEAVATLQKTRSDHMREWFEEHGSYSGHKHRVNLLGKPLPEKFTGKRETRTAFSIKEQREIYQRDNYTCRYCEIRVIDERVFIKMETVIGSEHFKAKGSTNALRHGMIFSFKATVDHVIPISYGGETTRDNGVTSCWNCNLGKYDALLYQMEIDDPRDRPVINKHPWDGLTLTL
jgi:hypothetical protein